jgi:hypothetical protein
LPYLTTLTSYLRGGLRRTEGRQTFAVTLRLHFAARVNNVGTALDKIIIYDKTIILLGFECCLGIAFDKSYIVYTEESLK